jgi:hypothetical protein
MGVDVEMKARLLLPMDEVAFIELRDAFRAEFPDEYALDHARYPDLSFERDDSSTLVLDTLHRFYGVGYERGHWPLIQQMGDWLAVHLGEQAQLRYGSDSGSTDWESLQPWAEARAELAAHWAAHGNEPYRNYFRSAGAA